MRKSFNIWIYFILPFAVLTVPFASLYGQEVRNSTPINYTEIIGWLKESNVPAVGIGIIADSELTECKVAGELRTGIPAPYNAIFTIASVTKTVTTIVTLKLAELGLWDLDEPLSNYWTDPDVSDDPRHDLLTTRHILSHQSGLPNWRSELESKKLEFLFEPGERYNYSGEGFEYLRKALEQKFNRTLDALSDSLLFSPLHMTDTRFHWNEGEDQSRFAFKHDTNGKVYLKQGSTRTSAASGLLTTIEDFARFGIYVMNHAGLSDSLFNDMKSTQVNIKKNFDQGLGWQIVRGLPDGEYALIHQGGEWGTVTMVILLPESKRGLIIFTNGDNGDAIITKVTEEYLNAGSYIMDVYNGMSYDPEQIAVISVPEEILSSYQGTYFIESFQMSVRIKFEDGILKLISPYSTMDMFAESDTKFFLKADDLKIEFISEDDSGIKGINIIYKGGDPEFAGKTK